LEEKSLQIENTQMANPRHPVLLLRPVDIIAELRIEPLDIEAKHPMDAQLP
jgi:hypothetical protein